MSLHDQVIKRRSNCNFDNVVTLQNYLITKCRDCFM